MNLLSDNINVGERQKDYKHAGHEGMTLSTMAICYWCCASGANSTSLKTVSYDV